MLGSKGNVLSNNAFIFDVESLFRIAVRVAEGATIVRATNRDLKDDRVSFAGRADNVALVVQKSEKR